MNNLAKNLFLVYVILKPFYFFSSGGLQIADIFLILSFLVILISSKINIKSEDSLASTYKHHRLIILFVLSTILINGIYFIIYFDNKFILSSFYYVFILMAISTFSSISNDQLFIFRLRKVFIFNLLLQVGIWALSIGRYYSLDRYMGTFNDPNQFAYFVFLSFLFIYVTGLLTGYKRLTPYYIAALFLIFLSGSTGMLLGVAIFTFSYALYILKHRTNPYYYFKSIAYSVFLIFILLLSIFLLNSNLAKFDNRFINNLTGYKRIEEKVNKAEGDSDLSIWEDRAIDTIYKYPRYILYGSGEGAYYRFINVTYYGNEIHSTLPSILFYYGVLPFLILGAWIYRQLKNLNGSMAIAYLALFTVSFILLNQRQSLFWILIVLGGLKLKINWNYIKENKV